MNTEENRQVVGVTVTSPRIAHKGCRGGLTIMASMDRGSNELQV